MSRDEADQPEELRRVLAARQPTELERQMLCSHPGAKCVCKSKRNRSTTQKTDNQGTGKSKNRMDPESTPMLALKCSRSGRISATALEQKGLTQYGVKFFAGVIQQTEGRRFINKSDGEPAMKALKDAAAKGPRRVESNGRESPVGDHHANGDIETAVKTPKAQMRATRFGLDSRLGRQLAHDDPIPMWILTLQVTRSRDSGKVPMAKTP